MTLHYLKIALRNMRKFRLQTIVCLTGLAVGMTCFALGTLWLRYIESFEDFVPEAENVCLVTRGIDQLGGGYDYNTTYSDGRELMEHFPEIKEFCTAYLQSNSMRAGDDGVEVRATQFVTEDTAFFRMFGIEALEGTVAHLRPGEIALTRSVAERMFGGSAAVGQRLTMNEADRYNEISPRDYRVTAVIPDCPQNTQFGYEAVYNPVVYDEEMKTERYLIYLTFVRLHDGARRDSVVGRELTVSHGNGAPESRVGENGEELHVVSYAVDHTYVLAPIREARTTYTSYRVTIGTDYVRWFMAIGLLVILCSLINYLVTMVSHLRRRGWEFSLRRVLGSSRVHIIYMVGMETLLTFLLAAALGYALTLLVLPEFREYSGIDIPLSSIAPRLLAYLGLVIAFGLAASVLTAWIVMCRTQRNILSSRQLAPSLEGRGTGGEAVLQMALSMAILFAVTVMLRQIDMIMYTDDLGFSHRNLVSVFNQTEQPVDFDQMPLVVEHLDSVEPLFPMHGIADMMLTDYATGETFKVEERNIDTAFYDFYRMKLITGRLPHWENWQLQQVCVNESFCEQVRMSPRQIVGTKFRNNRYSDEVNMLVTGVLQNAYVLGPTLKPMPSIFQEPYLHSQVFFHVVRVQDGRAQEFIDSMKAQFPGQFFFDNVGEEYERYVASERMLIKILFAVGGASLFVCVIGTFSLVSLSLQRRRKEIAVRKVHGARMKDILRLFLRGQIVSLLVAALVAYPVAYIIMRHWLEGYAKQVGIDWWIVPGTFLAISAVVLSAITLKIWRAARESTVAALNS